MQARARGFVGIPVDGRWSSGNCGEGELRVWSCSKEMSERFQVRVFWWL